MAKKLLYVVRYRLDKPFNLKAKFDGQIRAFEKLGKEATVLAMPYGGSTLPRIQ